MKEALEEIAAPVLGALVIGLFWLVTYPITRKMDADTLEKFMRDQLYEYW